MKTQRPLHRPPKFARLRWKSCSVFTIAILGLLLLPFIHFHPDNTHAHAGEIAVHHHSGHFHSQALDSLAHEVIHPGDHDADAPLHHDHSSQEHDSDQVEYTTLTLVSSIKNVSTNYVGWLPSLVALTTDPSINIDFSSYNPLSPTPHLKSSLAIRAPPLV